MRFIIKKILRESLEIKNVSDEEEYWDRIKIIAKNKNGDEIGEAIIDMQYYDDDGDYVDNVAKLEYLEVNRNFRDEGYGTKLMNAVVKYVKNRGYHSIYLLASPIGFSPRLSLNALTNFYKKFGFTIIKDFGNAKDMISHVGSLSEIYEDLEYEFSNTNGPEDDKYEIGMKEITIPNIRLNKEYEITEIEKNKIKNIKEKDLIIKQIYFDGKFANLSILFPWNSEFNYKGIIVDIQVIKNILYQPHITISKSLRNLGLGYKIYKALIEYLGHLYSGKGRVVNKNEIPRIWEKLKSEPNFITYSTDIFNISIIKNNPDKDKILKILKLNG